MENYNLVRPEHLNHHGYLFGGQMLSWIDESAWMAAARDFPNCTFVTRAMDRIDFKHQVKNGSILRFTVTKTKTGNSSVTYLVEVYEDARSSSDEKLTFSTTVTFVNINKSGKKQRILN